MNFSWVKLCQFLEDIFCLLMLEPVFVLYAFSFKKKRYRFFSLYFPKSIIDENKVIQVFNQIDNFLCLTEDNIHTDKVKKNVRKIYIDDGNLSPWWTKNGNIIIRHGSHYSENYVYTFSLIVLFAYRIGMRKNGTIMPPQDICRECFENLSAFFDELPCDTCKMRQYFSNFVEDWQKRAKLNY